MDFDARKARAMAALSSPSPDRSPKGGVDAPIIPLLDCINGHGSFFTTSSCSGRISILAHPSVPSGKTKAGGAGWIFVTHDPADPAAVVELLFNGAGRGRSSGTAPQGDVVFRFEPLIIAVECRDASAAAALVGTAIAAGFRESGITSLQKRIMVAIRCSIRMEVPIGKNEALAVPREYVQYLVGVANNKMAENKRRTDGLINMLRTKGLMESTNSCSDNIVDRQEKLGTSLSILNSKLDESVTPVGSARTDCLLSVGDSILKKDSTLKLSATCSDSDSTMLYNNETRNGESAICVGSVEEIHVPNKGCDKNNDGINNAKRLSCNASPDYHKSGDDYLSCTSLKISGESIEKLFLWGHSACAYKTAEECQAVIFGGFGGTGRHGRRSSTLILDKSGLLREISNVSSPTKRVGHSAVVLDNNLYVIGGRDGPLEIFDEVWLLNITQKKWFNLKCTGDTFLPRHRHACAAVGSKIYVFGGLSTEGLHQCMNILDTETRHWCNVAVEGEWPSARHSHCLVAAGKELIMFGGYDGQRALNDIYSFDVTNLKWKKLETVGAVPSPRFSHSMFIYCNFVGVIGGCPVTNQCPEIAFLNLKTGAWFYVSTQLLCRNLCVRLTTVVLDDELFIIGGGASCYAFGTKFSQPMKINLHILETMYERSSTRENFTGEQPHEPMGSSSNEDDKSGIPSSTNVRSVQGNVMCFYILVLEKKHAKVAKDILKRFGWLDLTRKVRISQDATHVHFPINGTLYNLLMVREHNSEKMFEGMNELNPMQPYLMKELEQYETVLMTLLSFGCSVMNDKLACTAKVSTSPRSVMRELLHSLLEKRAMPLTLLEQLPKRWDYLGDIVVLPKSSFSDPLWDTVGKEVWQVVAKSLGAQRVARQGRILPSGTRDSTLELLMGKDGWVTHKENGIFYSLDATKCMFSSGNRSEKLRMANLKCRDETVVDLFAGIGYFVLPFLVKASAKLVYACEWNPHAIQALRRNVHDNLVADRCLILEGDNRLNAPKGVADRVCLGLLPSSESSWAAAVRSLRVEGGVLHIHGNVKDSEERCWLEHVVASISDISKSEGRCWNVSLQHVEHVKWYAPHIRHVVADVVCKSL